MLGHLLKKEIVFETAVTGKSDLSLTLSSNNNNLHEHEWGSLTIPCRGKATKTPRSKDANQELGFCRRRGDPNEKSQPSYSPSRQSRRRSHGNKPKWFEDFILSSNKKIDTNITESLRSRRRRRRRTTGVWNLKVMNFWISMWNNQIPSRHV